MDVGQIKTQLAGRAESIARDLLPNGRKHGQEWCVGSASGEEGQSLKVHLVGDKAGVWNDFALGSGGDLLDLYCAVNSCDLVTAIKWAKDLLGIHEPEFHRTEKAKPYRKPEKPRNVTTPKSEVLSYLTNQRGLSPETLKAFQVGEIAAMEFDYKHEKIKSPAIVFPFKVGDDLVFIKYIGTVRPNADKPKDKLIKASFGCEPVLFGWQAFPKGARKALITEGEINAMSWHQVGVPALATPFGAGKGNKNAWIASEWERLEQFDEIYLDFHPDDAGKEATADLVERLGRHRCRVVPPMPDGHKDANDCLVARIAPEQMRALIAESKTQDPEELRSAAEFEDDVLAMFNGEDRTTKGVSLPFKSVQGKLELRPSETTLITGKRGQGKTEAINQITNHAMLHGERVLIASFEMKAKRLLYRDVRQMTGQREPSNEYIRQVMRWYYDRLWIFDHVGSANADRIFEVFEYARRRYGITFFVIDSLMKCGIKGKDSNAVYAAQDAFADRFVNFNNTHNTHGILVAHSNKEGGEDVMPTNDGVKGSGGLTDQVHNVIGIWRNKLKEVAIQKQMLDHQLSGDESKALNKADVVWVVDKQREGDGWVGHIELGFDPDSKQFVDAQDCVRPLLPFRADGVQMASDYDYDEEIKF